MAKIQILNGKKQGSVFDLNDGSEVDIGNRKSAKISIRDPWISYNHAKISGQSGRFFIEDLGSSNGTWINGEKIQRQELSPNSVIYLGKTKVKFLTADEAEDVATTEAPKAAPADDQTPWWDRVIETDDNDKGPSNIRIRRLESEIQEERRMRKALEKFLDLPTGSKPGDAAKAGELEAEVRRLKKQLEASSPEGGGDATAEAIEAALAEERERTEKLRREHMSSIVEMEGKVQQAESKVVDLERRLSEKTEQVKKEVGRAKEKQQAELDELKAALEESRKSATSLAEGSGDEALQAARERTEKLETELDAAREKVRAVEEQVETLTAELAEAKAASGSGGGERDGDAETLKSQLWAAVEEATKWKGEARKLQDEVEDARAEAEEWQEKHVQIVQEIDEISMEQIEIEEELKAKIDELTKRLGDGGDAEPEASSDDDSDDDDDADDDAD